MTQPKTPAQISLPQLQRKRESCAGCRNDYYNHGNHSDTGFCWSLPRARMVSRWAIGMQTPMDRRDRFRKVKVYNCFHGEGPYRDVYLERLPQHLGGDWADKREREQESSNV